MSQGARGFVLKWSLTVAVLLGALMWLDLSALGAAIRRIGLSAFTLAVLLSLVGSIVLPAISTRMALFADQVVLSLRELIIINLGMRFYALILPRAVSMAIRWQRYRARSDAARATALMVFERLVQLLVYLLAPLVFLALDPNPQIPAMAVISGLSLIALFIGVLMVIMLRRGAPPRTSPAAATWWQRQLHRLWTAIRAYRELDRAQLAAIIAVYVGTYLFLVSSGWVIAQAMALPLSWLQMAWIRPVIFLMTLFPLTVNGMGIRELGFVGVLALYGVDQESAFALGLSLSAVHLVIGLLGAMFELAHWGRGTQAK